MISPPPSSAFAASCQRYLDNGLSIVPIAPGTKRPGAYTHGAWHGMSKWNEYFARYPAPFEIDLWCKYPDAGIGLICGKLSNVIAVDVDTDDPAMLRMLANIMPPSPVRKKGKKGFTAFYRYAELHKSRSWDVQGQRVVDLLSDGRQTCMPGTPHPDGMTYVYLTDDALEDCEIGSLPLLPMNFSEQLDRVLGALQTPEDKAARRAAPVERIEKPGEAIVQSIASQLWREINTQALHRLDEWVPLMIPGAKPDTKGYRCRAFWRGATNLNVGVHRTGIFDFGGNYGLTAIDLVMYATNVNFSQASEALRKVLGVGGERFTMSIGDEAGPVPMPGQGTVDISKLLQNRRHAPSVAVLGPREEASAGARVMLAEIAAKAEEEQAEAEKIMYRPPEFVTNAPGMIGKIADWINATAKKPQPELAVVGALTLIATVMGRRYRTDYDNWASMYFVMVAKSGEGKDHPMQCVRAALNEAGLFGLLGGSGYTSQAGVFTELYRAPSHLAIIDEIGQMLKATASKNGAFLATAINELLKAFSSVNTLLSPPTKSANGKSAEQLKLESRGPVYNPAISILGATTPDVFYSALSEEHFEGGFVGRLVIVESLKPRGLGEYPKKRKVPKEIIDWLKELVAEHQALGNLAGDLRPDMEAVPVEMYFAPECAPLLVELEMAIIDKQCSLESENDEALLARTKEKAQRMAMLVAKAVNSPRDNIIRTEALEWAIKYVRHYDFTMATNAQARRPQTKSEDAIKKALGFIKRARKYNEKMFLRVTRSGGMPHAMLLQKMKMDSREFAAVMNTAMESGRVHRSVGFTAPGYVYNGIVYWVPSAPSEEEDDDEKAA